VRPARELALAFEAYVVSDHHSFENVVAAFDFALTLWLDINDSCKIVRPTSSLRKSYFTAHDRTTVITTLPLRK
jgi:hypothetical protein